MSILDATHRAPVRSVIAEHVGNAAVEAEVAGEGAINRPAPIAAEGTHSVERTNAAVADSGHGQF